ncbi:ABC transporter permease [Actinokineospora globicatena]|uniref:ABC transporter permease n=1 Tax=Actinokineospora globicatena TaxID=103729 RepID=UPI0020A2ACF8|nr:ABC transporter permease subunit [Actinokineospora globicatena]MCP2300508.1 ABC-2 type transport system permease protein [Actinokineospora globicatena]GLW81051.1 membrane protein [Actinokineospora globicatena]GLW88244.1 membrane protein [Actinokineospora globicatena]
MTTMTVRRAPITRVLRSELRMVLRRPRTLVGLGLLGLVPVVMGIGIAIAAASGETGEGAEGMAALVMGNGMLLPIFALSIAVAMLLPLTGAMLAADALAGESSHGTLRGMLMAPVSRGRLLAVKAFGVASVTLLAVVLMAVTGMIAGVALLGGDGMLTASGTSLPFADALGRVLITVVYVTLQVWALSALALAVSAYTEHPLIVVVVTLGVVIVSGVLSAIPALDWIDPVLITTSWEAVGEVISDPISWSPLVEGALRAACYMLIGGSIAYSRMLTRDG